MRRLICIKHVLGELHAFCEDPTSRFRRTPKAIRTEIEAKPWLPAWLTRLRSFSENARRAVHSFVQSYLLRIDLATASPISRQWEIDFTFVIGQASCQLLSLPFAPSALKKKENNDTIETKNPKSYCSLRNHQSENSGCENEKSGKRETERSMHVDTMSVVSAITRTKISKIFIKKNPDQIIFCQKRHVSMHAQTMRKCAPHLFCIWKNMYIIA